MSYQPGSGRERSQRWGPSGASGASGLRRTVAAGGATFRAWLDPAALGAPETVHGLLFDTPRGPLAALWDRTDGYVLSDLSAKPYRAPEPWIDPWATKTPVVLPANADTVTVVDSIGRETAVPAQSGAVTVVLDGAVRLVRGLDAARLPLVEP